jgi:hypothetical protein
MSISSGLEVPKGGLILEKYPEGKQFQKQVMRLSLTDEEILQEMLKPENVLKIAFGKSMVWPLYSSPRLYYFCF